MAEPQVRSVDVLALKDGQPATYESAIQWNENMLNKLALPAKHKALYKRLWKERSAIEAISRRHVGLTDERYRCTVGPTKEWLRGGFNVCIPVRFESPDGGDQKSLLFRCPLPHKPAEEHYPGTVDEKVGCEVGAYVWMQEHCLDVRIPHLYGFGFADGRQFVHASHCPWYIRAKWAARRLLSKLFRYPVPSLYVSRPAGVPFSSAYVLLERIGPETGRMLALSWDKEHREDPARRRRLFSGMARIIISLARIPQPQIGSFRFHDDGTISLTNRPLTTTIALLETDGAPRVLDRGAYTNTEPYVSDMLSFHDRSFLSNPNATDCEKDCQRNLPAKTALRALAHNYIRRESRDGPFVLQFTDFNAANVFVDDEWNVTCLIDLEWVCALPVEKLAVPYWLTNRGIDELDGECLVEFDKTRQEFMLAFEKEEQKMMGNKMLSRVMRETWESGGIWFWHSLSSINAAQRLVYDHLAPRFTKKFLRFREAMHEFWCEGSDKVIQTKLAEYEKYDEALRKVYGRTTGITEPAETTGPGTVGDPVGDERKE